METTTHTTHGTLTMIELLTFDSLMALATLTILEIVLGIDNIVFISVLTSRLPKEKEVLARKLGLAAALITRLLLLTSLAWFVKLTNPLFTIADNAISVRDLILLLGGLFLLWKATMEIHSLTMAEDHDIATPKKKASFWGVIMQIAVIDIVFSLDSVITAVGMVKHIEIMVLAILIAIVVMLVAVEGINRFIHEHPTTKMLAFSMLMLIGVSLMADGLDVHIPRGYIYFAISFSLFVETLNIYSEGKRKKRKPKART